MATPEEQYNGLYGRASQFAEHKVGDKVRVVGMAGQFEIVHIAEATEDQPVRYVVYDGIDFPFEVPVHQVKEMSKL